MGLQVDINNASSYKNCAKKQYEIYVCMPPKNTIVINKLEQADVVKALGGRTYFTVDEIEKMQKTGNPRLAELQQLVGQGRAYAVTDATPFVLCGTVGEMWTIKPDKLASIYNFLQGGQPLAINQQTLNQRLNGKYLDWTLIRTSPQATAGQNMACFVPSSQKGQIQTSWGSILNYNGVGVSHGKGDFIVCGKLPNGQPNLADRWVVNGEIFATTYNNQGWTQCLGASVIKSINISNLPKLVRCCNQRDEDIQIAKVVITELNKTGLVQCHIQNFNGDEYFDYPINANGSNKTIWYDIVSKRRWLCKSANIGLVFDENNVHVILNDMLGTESEYGDTVSYSVTVHRSAKYVYECLVSIFTKIKTEYENYEMLWRRCLAEFGNREKGVTGQKFDEFTIYEGYGQTGKTIGLRSSIASSIGLTKRQYGEDDIPAFCVGISAVPCNQGNPPKSFFTYSIYFLDSEGVSNHEVVKNKDGVRGYTSFKEAYAAWVKYLNSLKRSN